MQNPACAGRASAQVTGVDRTTPHCTALHRTAPHSLHNTTLHHTGPHHPTPPHTTLHYTTPGNATPHRTVQHHTATQTQVQMVEPTFCSGPARTGDKLPRLAVLGVLSAEGRLPFRAAIRDTWMNRGRHILPRFVLRGVGASAADTQEAARHGDVVFVRAAAKMSRSSGPLISLMLWFECAVRQAPVTPEFWCLVPCMVTSSTPRDARDM